jgi:hypothetical protein
MICPNLTKLVVERAARITNSGFQAFLSHSSHLCSLSIFYAPAFTSEVFPIIISHCPHLLHLQIDNMIWFRESEIDLLAESSLKLEYFQLPSNLSETSSRSVAHLIQKMPSLLELKAPRDIPMVINLMILREIALKCILNPDPKIQLIGLRTFDDRCPYSNSPGRGEYDRELSQMEAALHRFVEFLSHENNEVCDKILIRYSIVPPPPLPLPQVREISATLLYQISMQHWQTIIDAGALTKALSLSMNAFPRGCSRMLFQLADVSEESRHMILSDGLVLLTLNPEWSTVYTLFKLINQLSMAQLRIGFSALASAIKSRQTNNPNIFLFGLSIVQHLTGARKPDLMIRPRMAGTIWNVNGTGDISSKVIQSLIDAGVIEATLGAVLSVGDRTNYEICCDILLAFSYNAQDLILPMGLLEAFISFHPKGARKSCSLNVLFACVVNLSSHDSHLPLIEQSGLIQMLFSHEISDDLLLQIQKLMQRTQENGRTQFFRHLVNCGLITVFVSAYKWKSKLKAVSCQAIVECLLMIMRADEEFKKILDAMKLPRLLAPLLVKGFSN